VLYLSEVVGIRPCCVSFAEPLLAVGVDVGQHCSEGRNEGRRDHDNFDRGGVKIRGTT
jgi:hypothetical protein